MYLIKCTLYKRKWRKLAVITPKANVTLMPEINGIKYLIPIWRIFRVLTYKRHDDLMNCYVLFPLRLC